MSGPPLPTPAVLDPGQFINLVNVFYFSRQALVASGAWAVYDHMLSLDLEIRYVWLKPWGISKLFFFWTRYFGMVILLLTIMGGVLSQPFPTICLLIYYCGAWGGVVTMSTVSLIMLLRIRAIYTGNRAVVVFLSILVLGYIAAECTIFGTAFATPWLPPVAYYSLGLNGCFASSTSSPQMFGLWIARLGLDTIMLCFVLYKSYQQYKEGWGSGLIDLLIRHNIMGFVLIVCVQLMNLLVTLLADPQASILGVGFAIATDVIVGSRLLLHTREAVYKRSEDESTTLVQLSDLRIGASSGVQIDFSSDDHDARRWMSVYSVAEGAEGVDHWHESSRLRSDDEATVVPSIVIESTGG